MIYDALVVGGGMAGLTASAYLAKNGMKTLLCEKEDIPGGLVRTFERNGFRYDGGIRAFENSGILFPMLKQLGIHLNLVKNDVTIGIEDRVIHLKDENSIEAYRDLLIYFYPELENDIHAIIEQMKKIAHYMDVQYSIKNPMFLDIKQDRDYFMKVVFPWMFKYAAASPRIAALNVPVADFLKRYTQNQSLIDIISQHFFQATPAFFALSYIKLYLDYHYPVGGTGMLVQKLTALIKEFGGEIRTGTAIVSIDPTKHTAATAEGEIISYRQMVWAADLQTLYRIIDENKIIDPEVKKAFIVRKGSLSDKTGGDSIFTLFLAVDLSPEYFSQKASAHFFYTPHITGQTQAGPIPLGKKRGDIEQWLNKFYELTTYEISIPALRDRSMAPKGKTGLIISLLFDFQLTKNIREQGWYDAFKLFSQKKIMQVLEGSIFPGLGASVIEQFSSTPLTMQRTAGTLDGAITGWAFTNDPIPAESRLPKVANSIKTPLPDIAQAGQWTFSPSGFPVAILTGKMSTDHVIKKLKNREKRSSNKIY